MSKKKATKKVALEDFLSEKTSKSWGEREEETPTVPTKEEPKKEEPKPEPVETKEVPKEVESKQYNDSKPRETQKRVYEPVDESKIPTTGPFVVFVGNLSFKAIEDDIAELFGFENVVHVNIPMDKQSGRPRGYAYVEFKTVDGLKNALKLNGQEFYGRSIRVDLTEQKQKSFDRDDGFQQHRQNRYKNGRDNNTSRYDTSRYGGQQQQQQEPSKSDSEDKWARKTKEQPKPKDFGSAKTGGFGGSSSSGEKKKPEKPSSTELFGEGKAWEPTDALKKVEEKIEREKEERRKRLEAEQGSKSDGKGGFQKKKFDNKKGSPKISDEKEKKEHVKPRTQKETKQEKSSNVFDVLAEE